MTEQPESPQPPMRHYGEKDEKQEEKDEKNRHEKSREEKWRRDPLGAAAWALILIWLGLVLLAGTSNILAPLTLDDIWPWFFVGAGGILVLEVVFRWLIPAYRGPFVGTLIVAFIFLAIGLSNLQIATNVDWPVLVVGVAVIVIGLALLLRGFGRRRM